MAKHQTLPFCTHCWDRLRPTVFLTAEITSPLRTDWREDEEYGHTTRRTRRGYRPDVKYVAVHKVKLRWNARNKRRDFHMV